jgi:hypothetical protein
MESKWIVPASHRAGFWAQAEMLFSFFETKHAYGHASVLVAASSAKGLRAPKS